MADSSSTPKDGSGGGGSGPGSALGSGAQSPSSRNNSFAKRRQSAPAHVLSASTSSFRRASENSSAGSQGLAPVPGSSAQLTTSDEQIVVNKEDIPVDVQNVTLQGVANAIEVAGGKVIVNLTDSFNNLTESFRRGLSFKFKQLEGEEGPSGTTGQDSSNVNVSFDHRRKRHSIAVVVGDGSGKQTQSFRVTSSGKPSQTNSSSSIPLPAVASGLVSSPNGPGASHSPEKESPKHASFGPDAPCLDLTWKNVTVTAPNGEKILLSDASGSVRGHLLAIMGPSGCGKTTLLNYLACRPARVATKDGKSQISGTQYTRADLKRVSGYVMQTDLVNGRLTVEETLMYTAHLRLPTTLTNEEKRQRVDIALDQVGLSHVRHTLVGDPLNKGISGGERKRLCVAMELLLQPRLLFLDEPTAGLDSVTALKVMEVLKGLASSGACTVLCTLSQPQSKIFALFDDLILMCNGRIAYNGPARDAVKAFAERGHPCPPNTNPADHLIDVLIQDSQLETMAKKVQYDGYEDPKDYKPLPLNFNRQPWFRQFVILFGRTWTDVTRNRLLLWTQLVQTVVMAILIGFVFFRMGTGPSSMVKRLPVLFFCVVNQGVFGALMMINSFPAERILVIRERYAGTYYVSSYFMSKLAADIPNIITPALFSCIVYWLVGLQPVASKFFLFVLFMILCCIAATSMAMMISAICRTATLSVTVLPMVLEVCRLFGGYFLSPKDMPVYFQWLGWISYCKYVYVGVALNELHDLQLDCPENDLKCMTTVVKAMTDRGLEEYTIGGCLGALFLIIFITRVVAYLALRYLK